MKKIRTQITRAKYFALSALTAAAVSIPFRASAQANGGGNGGVFNGAEQNLTNALTLEGVQDQTLTSIPKLIFGVIGTLLFISVALLVGNAIRENAERQGQNDWTATLVGLMVFAVGLLILQFASTKLFGA